MNAREVLRVCRLLEESGVHVWLDGGWGIDALLREQTRSHKDLDLVARAEDVALLKEILGRKGFTLAEGTATSFILRDHEDREVDVHVVRFDEEGNGVYRMQNDQDWIYPAEGFRGRGAIEGKEVLCLSPAVQILCHAHGYTPTEKDFRDMKRLSERFRIELPPQLQVPRTAETPG